MVFGTCSTGGTNMYMWKKEVRFLFHTSGQRGSFMNITVRAEMTVNENYILWLSVCLKRLLKENRDVYKYYRKVAVVGEYNYMNLYDTCYPNHYS